MRPTIRPATNTVITARIEHAVQAGAGAAGRDLAEHHVEHRAPAAEAGVGVVERVHRTGRGQRRRRRRTPPSRRRRTALGALHRRADRGRHGAVVLQLRTASSALTLTTAEDRHRRRRSRSPACLSPTIRPNVRGSENGITSSRKISSQLVHVVGFSNGCARVGVVEAAAVGAELLDGLLAGHRAAGDGLLCRRPAW